MIYRDCGFRGFSSREKFSPCPVKEITPNFSGRRWGTTNIYAHRSRLSARRNGLELHVDKDIIIQQQTNRCISDKEACNQESLCNTSLL